MEKFINMKYDKVGGVREYIKTVNVFTRLSELRCPINDNFLFNHVFNFVCFKFDALETSYNTHE